MLWDSSGAYEKRVRVRIERVRVELRVLREFSVVAFLHVLERLSGVVEIQIALGPGAKHRPNLNSKTCPPETMKPPSS